MPVVLCIAALALLAYRPYVPESHLRASPTQTHYMPDVSRDARRQGRLRCDVGNGDAARCGERGGRGVSRARSIEAASGLIQEMGARGCGHRHDNDPVERDGEQNEQREVGERQARGFIASARQQRRWCITARARRRLNSNGTGVGITNAALETSRGTFPPPNCSRLQ